MWTGLFGLLILAVLDDASARVTRPMLEAMGIVFGAGLLLSETPTFWGGGGIPAPLMRRWRSGCG